MAPMPGHCSHCGAPVGAALPGTRVAVCRFCGTAQAGARAPLVASFRDPKLTGWEPPPRDRHEHRPSTGELALSCDPPGITRSSMATVASFDDVELGVTLRFDEGVEAIAGVDLRACEQGSYDFRFTGKGSFMATRYADGKTQDWLVSPRSHPALEVVLGNPNRLVIAMKRDRVRVWINGQLAATFSETTLKRGTISLSAFCREERTRVTFSDLELYETED